MFVGPLEFQMIFRAYQPRVSFRPSLERYFNIPFSFNGETNSENAVNKLYCSYTDSSNYIHWLQKMTNYARPLRSFEGGTAIEHVHSFMTAIEDGYPETIILSWVHMSSRSGYYFPKRDHWSRPEITSYNNFPIHSLLKCFRHFKQDIYDMSEVRNSIEYVQHVEKEQNILPMNDYVFKILNISRKLFMTYPSVVNMDRFIKEYTLDDMEHYPNQIF